MPEIVTTDPLVARLQRNERADQELRQAYATLGGIVQHLPSTDDLMLTPESMAAWRIVRQADPSLYLTFLAVVRERSGRHTSDLVKHHIGPATSGPRRDIQLLSYDDLLAQPEPEWSCDGRIPKFGFGCAYGPPGVGKSFAMVHMALSAARGSDWFGRSMKQCGVIYVAAEGRQRDRIAAYVQHQHLSAADISRFRVIESAIDLSGPTEDLEQLERIIPATADQLGGIGLVVIDTLSRVLVGADENAAQGMGGFIGACKRIEEATGGLVLAIHHSGKDPANGARGHSSLRAATDVEIAFTKADDGGLRTAKFTKLRDGQDGEELHFRLQAVNLGDGRGSVVVVPSDEQPKAAQRSTKLTADERVAQAALREEIGDTGVPMPYTSVLPGGVKGVTVEAWRTRFYARLGDSRDVDQAAKRQAWNRGRKGLIAKNIAGCWEDWAWLW